MKQEQITNSGMARFMKRFVGAALAGALWICLATTACFATDWWMGVDNNPRQVGPTAWLFTIRVPVQPVGQLQFVGSQYDFAAMTQEVAVDYKFNRAGMDFVSDPGGFCAIAPTLFNPMDGYMHGWDITDLRNGTFQGVVHSAVPPISVSFTIAADALVPVHGR